MHVHFFCAAHSGCGFMSFTTHKMQDTRKSGCFSQDIGSNFQCFCAKYVQGSLDLFGIRSQGNCQFPKEFPPLENISHRITMKCCRCFSKHTRNSFAIAERAWQQMYVHNGTPLQHLCWRDRYRQKPECCFGIYQQLDPFNQYDTDGIMVCFHLIAKHNAQKMALVLFTGMLNLSFLLQVSLRFFFSRENGWFCWLGRSGSLQGGACFVFFQQFC